MQPPTDNWDTGSTRLYSTLYLIIFVPGDSLGSEHKPVVSRGAFDEGDRNTQPTLANHLVTDLLGATLRVFALGRPGG